MGYEPMSLGHSTSQTFASNADFILRTFLLVVSTVTTANTRWREDHGKFLKTSLRKMIQTSLEAGTLELKHTLTGSCSTRTLTSSQCASGCQSLTTSTGRT